MKKRTSTVKKVITIDAIYVEAQAYKAKTLAKIGKTRVEKLQLADPIFQHCQCVGDFIVMFEEFWAINPESPEIVKVVSVRVDYKEVAV